MMRIIIKNLQKRFPINEKKIITASKAALKLEKAPDDCELSILFCDDSFIKELNKKYLKKNSPTDVIAFPIDDYKKKTKKQSCLLGDIAISVDTICENARRFNKKDEDELIFCVIHGILHLLGYEDYTQKDKSKMLDKQQRYLKLVLN